MSKRADGSYSSAWRGLTKIVVPPLLAAFTKHEWHGQDNIRNIPSSSGVILAANHLSYADPLPLCLFTHRAGRYPVFLAKSSLFEIKGLGAVMRGTGQLPVYRGQSDAALVLRDVEQGLRDGACVIFYPEGTATRDPGPVADGAKDRRGQGRPGHRRAGDPGRAVGGPADPALRQHRARTCCRAPWCRSPRARRSTCPRSRASR